MNELKEVCPYCQSPISTDGTWFWCPREGCAQGAWRPAAEDRECWCEFPPGPSGVHEDVCREIARLKARLAACQAALVVAREMADAAKSFDVVNGRYEGFSDNTPLQVSKLIYTYRKLHAAIARFTEAMKEISNVRTL